jgi:hypothetical protein
LLDRRHRSAWWDLWQLDTRALREGTRVH